MTRRTQTLLELIGYAAAVVGISCIGWVLAGPVLAAGLGLVVAAVVLIFLGNL